MAIIVIGFGLLVFILSMTTLPSFIMAIAEQDAEKISIGNSVMLGIGVTGLSAALTVIFFMCV